MRLALLNIKRGKLQVQATLSISVLNRGRAILSCHHSHCVIPELIASDLALESSLLHLHLPLHSPQLSSSHLILKTQSNLQILATGDTHLAYHPGCSWPKVQTPVSPPVAIPAGGSLGGGRLSLSWHKELPKGLPQSKCPTCFSYYC